MLLGKPDALARSGWSFGLHLLSGYNVFEQFGNPALLRSGQLRGLGKELRHFAVGRDYRGGLRQPHDGIRSDIIEFGQLKRVFCFGNPAGLLPVQNPRVDHSKLARDFAQAEPGLITQIPEVAGNFSIGIALIAHGHKNTPCR